MKIAVDFDGTIVENSYPKIGQPMLFAFETLKALQRKGHLLILWTCRSGERLKEAVAFCNDNEIEFYAINNNYLEEERDINSSNDKISRKIDADIFIDDRNIGGFIGWSQVWQLIHPESGDINIQYVNKAAHENFKRQSFFGRIFKQYWMF